MSAVERRYQIMKILCRRRSETVNNLAAELKVSPRTIERDIEFLSTTEPIYTQFGRYNGGVYVVEGYSMDRMYMNDDEIGVLQKIFAAVDGQPDIAFFFDVPAETAVHRVRLRPAERDRYIDMELQYKLRREYIDICKANGGVLISTEQSEDECYALVKRKIKEILKNENF